MSIDWTATGSMLTAFAGFATAAAIGATAWVGWRARQSFEDWKKQEIFRENRKLAIDVLAASHEAKHVFESIRSPMSFGGEITEVEKIIESWEGKYRGHVDDQKTRITTLTRLNKYADYWEKIIRLIPISKATFGEEATEFLMAIMKARIEVSAAAETFADLTEEDEFKREMRGKLWRGLNKEDSIDKILDDAEAGLERLLSPYVRE